MFEFMLFISNFIRITYQICSDALSIPFPTEALHMLEEHIANQGLPNDSNIDQVSQQNNISTLHLYGFYAH